MRLARGFDYCSGMARRDGSFDFRRILPSAVTTIRLAAAPAFLFAFLDRPPPLAAVLYVLAVLTDLLDGVLARRLGAVSGAGGYYDAIADFIFIASAFSAFCAKGWYGWPVFLPIAASFACFVLSSGAKRPVYDPVGKRIGAFLMLVIGINLLCPLPLLLKSCFVLIIFVCVASIAFRVAYLARSGRGD